MTRSAHDKKIARISSDVRAFYAQKKPFRIFHGSTNSTRILSFKSDEMLDVSDLDEIISIDTTRHVAVVEPNVPMDTLIKATLRKGLIPPVVPEFPGITVGGAIQGGAGESSSFKWGFFSQTVNRIDYVLGDGSLMSSTPDDHADLFYGAAGSCGSLGVITAAEIKLIPAKSHVKLTYTPSEGSADLVDRIDRQSAIDTIDFLDAIAFAHDKSLIITGVLADKPARHHSQKFHRARDEWYYLHAQAIMKRGKEVVEYVPITDYLFRYNRGAFWVGRFAFELFDVPFSRLSRFLLNPILNTRKLYQALQVSGASQEYIVQDLTLAVEKSVNFLHYIDDRLGIYPLWICPVKPEPRSPLLCNGIDTSLAINIGVWGPRITDYDDFKEANRDIERTLGEYGGKKWMYAHTYYTKEEFWSIYDKSWYDELRRRYHGATLPSIYDKVVVKKRYEVNIKRGLFKTILGIAKLRIEP